MKTILSLALIGVALMGKAQSVKSTIFVNGFTKLDSIGYEDKVLKIPCIAYTSFTGGKLEIIEADTVVKKYQIAYLWKWHSKAKIYYLTSLSMPINFLHMNGQSSTEQNITYWYKNKQINPIEIITKTTIK